MIAMDWRGGLKTIAFTISILLTSVFAHAESGRIDYDLDDDGLIEINDLSDLNEIRNNLDGTSLYASSAGCPVSGCNGFELTVDLDFDTDGSGAIDADDGYWNSGEGWLPIVDNSLPSTTYFESIFEGNDFEIRNLFINSSATHYVGLFGKSANSQFRNLNLTGSVASISGGHYVGALLGYGNGNVEISNVHSTIPVSSPYNFIGGLVGSITGGIIFQSSVIANVTAISGGGNWKRTYVGGLAGMLHSNSEIKESYVQGDVTGETNIGGLAGSAIENNLIKASFFAGNVNGSASYIGGIVGRFGDLSGKSGNFIESVFSTGSVTGGGSTAGLVGGANAGNQILYSFSVSVLSGGLGSDGLMSYGDASVFHSYWAVDKSGKEPNAYANEKSGRVGVDLWVLKCPIRGTTNSFNSHCVSTDGSAENLQSALTIYNNWQASGFLGEEESYVGYWDFGSVEQLPGLMINGVIYRDSDADGVLDNLDPIWADTDNDGVADLIDFFPNNTAASKDEDADGLPDEWIASCDLPCQQDSGLILDLRVNDTDNDGVINSEDAFIENFAASQDIDNDGQPDEWNENCDLVCQDTSGLQLDTNVVPIRNDYDLDDDGLIEVNNLTDLDDIRRNLDGSSLYGHSNGCPVAGCFGFELTADLDFDTNHDGLINDQDEFWNDGKGWEPIGKYIGYQNEYPFTADFNGNFFKIKNLYINRQYEDQVGLFGFVRKSVFENIGFTGVLMFIRGRAYVGPLAGRVFHGLLNGSIKRTYSYGTIEGISYVGGLVGRLSEHSTLEAVFTNNDVSGVNSVGGIVGSSDLTKAKAVYSVSNVSGDRDVGGLIGSSSRGESILASYFSGTINKSGVSAELSGGLIGSDSFGESFNAIVNDSYWALDTSTVSESLGATESTSYVGLQSRVLQCGVQANTSYQNSSCLSSDGADEGFSQPLTMYKDWDLLGQEIDGVLQPYWDFGSSDQLPALVFNNILHRDSDGDFIWDEVDEFPLDFDNDGVTDAIDIFPRVFLGDLTDTDKDGAPNECDQACIDLGMAADSDDDNDGIADAADAYPLVSIGELTDTDSDGAPDECDQTCIDLGMAADSDDDNDGIADAEDAYPLISIGALTDTDQDGSPDNCDQACINLGMTADSDDDNDGIADNLDAYSLISIGQLTDTDQDGSPNYCDQACADLGMTADSDDDNDGIADDSDAHPLVPIGFLTDTDQDGAPNNCDQACIDLGMTADSDDDNDGIADTSDAYPLISIAQLVDTDQDGRPNECDQACIDSGMSADNDDDNDGVLDINDAFSLISIGALTDTDQDGSPNDCNQACIDLGMIADVDNDNDGIVNEADTYPLVSIGQLMDTDQDGEPNDCDQACIDSGMVADNDDDNDGLLDINDLFSIIAIGDLLDTDHDGAPDECDQVCIDLGMTADSDDDNDGIADDSDAHQLISIGVLTDTDQDGSPNNCDQACINLGMTADSDDDNDGIADDSDAYSLISIGQLTDTDQDGSPNNCDQACINLGMSADSDDDNDGIVDDSDAHPLISIGALTDTDHDGLPNDCDQTCIDLGMTADSDDDNDGIVDDSDAHPLISIGALTDTDHDGLPNNCDQACINLGMTADSDDDNDGIADDSDAYSLISIGKLTDTDQDGSPNNCDQACIDLGMSADNDDDNDGVLDINDAFSLISIGALTDTDHDGLPNDCDQACIDLGMFADSDDDNDGIADDSDAHQLISIGVLTDTDQDGSPDNCDQACIDLGMVADNDDDNDGLLDVNDQFPIIAIGNLLDTDYDGAPDECDQVCIDLGMTADSDDDNDGVDDLNDDFSLLAEVSVDTDSDGWPDRWNETCHSDCRLNSKLTLDLYVNDTDNDGVSNNIDLDNFSDNGTPELLSIPANIDLAVNSHDGRSVELEFNEVEFYAVDAIDSDFSYKAFYQNKILTIENGLFSLPAGRNEIEWVAVDSSGNMSEPLIQIINVFPIIQFETPESITAEGLLTAVKIKLSGHSPKYPVKVNWTIDQILSDTDMSDFEESFDLSLIYQISILQPVDESIPFIEILLPLASNDTIENDEMILLKLVEDGASESLLAVDVNKNTHSLMITHDNLAPTLQLQLMQGGLEVANISPLGGDVSIRAIIEDANTEDEHSLQWDFGELNLAAPIGNVVRFSPIDLDVGDYKISVKVTDNGLNPKSSEETLVLKVVATSVEDLKEQFGSLFWLLLMLPLFIRRARV